jgi:hypothetical protein
VHGLRPWCFRKHTKFCHTAVCYRLPHVLTACFFGSSSEPTLLPLLILLFATTIDLRLMGTSPDEDFVSYVHVAHGLEVSSQTNTMRARAYVSNIFM